MFIFDLGPIAVSALTPHPLWKFLLGFILSFKVFRLWEQKQQQAPGQE